ncbi:hypothetical protein KVR01_007896 [Diaporthe batatas]|uniref:uncharacterized protein n=1 Tax=Diaporthe batatas TaxID=748121 RepID=UPI001D043F38|nr:uncharacterized protein KVR01_007896 [Diaporthe batatas]KAG8162131.1 hypothetical protein KVR01_007896 [Diaporthe batatas]
MRDQLGRDNPIIITSGGIGGDFSHGCTFVEAAVYYTPPLTTADELEQAARALETVVLRNRLDTYGAPYERLDVYSLPPTTTGDEADEDARDGLFASAAGADAAVRRCVAHQRAEIAARRERGGKEWFIQRYDVPKGDWGRAIVVVRTHVAEWEWERPDKTGRGLVLSTVMFDHTEEGAAPDEVWVASGSAEGDVWVLVHEVRSELNWEHSYVQFLD